MRIPDNMDKILQLCQEDAEKGDVEAMLKVARIYSRYRVAYKALSYCQKAAALGNVEAMEVQGEIFFYGRGVSRDIKTGLRHYEQAAEGGSLKAMRELGWIYSTGVFGVPKDLNKVRQYYEKGADAGDRDAMHNLAMYYQGRIPGANVDLAEAFSLLKRAAEQNHQESMYELGRCYRDGIGIPRDLSKAKKWFLEASSTGHSESLFALAMMVVGNALRQTEKQTIKDLIQSKPIEVRDVFHEQFQWYSATRVKTADPQGNNKTLLVEDFNLADATFLLARLLASTLDQDKLQIANKLMSKLDRRDRHDLLAWLSVLVEDLHEEEEALSHLKLSLFDTPKELQPIALIGQGRFGKVYLSWFNDLTTPRFVAVKFVDVNLARKDLVPARNVVREQWACRVLKEMDVHHTVKYLGYMDLPEHRKRGLVFELCADMTQVEELAKVGRHKVSWDAPIQLDLLPDWTAKVPSSLRSCVVFCEVRKWTTLQVITMLREIAEALLEVHKIGFIHRNIAPRNILCNAEGNVQLADFGWAKFVGCSDDDASLLAHYGKACLEDNHQYALAWWAPECFGFDEQQTDAVFSWNSDVYAFGVTMWQCFSHKDPFSHATDPDQIRNMIIKRERPCLAKKPDVGSELDGNSPDDLIALIGCCWKHNPSDRLTLRVVVEELRKIETNLRHSRLPMSKRRSYKGDPHESCHDLGTRIYRPLKGEGQNPLMLSDVELFGGQYADVLQIRRLEKIHHRLGTIKDAISEVENSLGETPYDVFLVHAGEQKMGPVETMKSVFLAGGLRCCLDQCMQHGSDLGQSIRFALTTCRYAVVVLSSEFFTKQHPASKLMYAYRRMEWIRKNHDLQGWDSLFVVLYNMTLQQYKNRQRIDGIELPDSFSSDVVWIEYSDSGRIPWRVECLNMKRKIIEQDSEGALSRWVKYLEQYSNQMPNDFPSADIFSSDVTKATASV